MFNTGVSSCTHLFMPNTTEVNESLDGSVTLRVPKADIDFEHFTLNLMNVFGAVYIVLEGGLYVVTLTIDKFGIVVSSDLRTITLEELKELAPDVVIEYLRGLAQAIRFIYGQDAQMEIDAENDARHVKLKLFWEALMLAGITVIPRNENQRRLYLVWKKQLETRRARQGFAPSSGTSDNQYNSPFSLNTYDLENNTVPGA